MQMKAFCLFFCCLFIIALNGCGELPAVKYISDKTDYLREDKFEIQYPSDWEVSGTEDDNSADKRSTYSIVHPENKKCRITIHRSLVLDNDADPTASFNKMALERIRELKDEFSNSGYKNFSFYTTKSSFTGREATKLVIKGVKNDVTRELTTYMIIHNKNFYAISYDWFNNWNSSQRAKVTKAIDSFNLIH